MWLQPVASDTKLSRSKNKINANPLLDWVEIFINDRKIDVSQIKENSNPLWFVRGSFHIFSCIDPLNLTFIIKYSKFKKKVFKNSARWTNKKESNFPEEEKFSLFFYSFCSGCCIGEGMKFKARFSELWNHVKSKLFFDLIWGPKRTIQIIYKFICDFYFI